MKRVKGLSPVELILAPILFIVGFVAVEGRKLFASWRRDGLKQQSNRMGFPPGFKVQRIGIASVAAVAELPPSEIAVYFREHPRMAKALVSESCDKRYSPSTFISEESHELFRVGWYSTKMGYECVRDFANLADAATDYLLFSRGKGRWTPPD